MRRPLRATWLLAVALPLAVASRAARAECVVDRDLFTCPDWGVEMFVPADWELSAQTSYPGILASGVHRPGRGRLTLAAQKLAPDELLKGYADRNRAALEKVGFRTGELTAHPTGAYVMDVTSSDRKRRLRQGYLTHGGVAYVLTIAAPMKQLSSYHRAFDDTLRSIRFLTVEPPTPTPFETPPASNAP